MQSDAAGATPALATPGPSKRAKHPAYQLPDLSHIVALCDERIPFAALAAQLTRRNILYHGPSVEAQGTALALKLVALPSVDGVARPLMAALQRRLLAATVRMQVCWTCLSVVFRLGPGFSSSYSFFLDFRLKDRALGSWSSSSTAVRYLRRGQLSRARACPSFSPTKLLATMMSVNLFSQTWFFIAWDWWSGMIMRAGALLYSHSRVWVNLKSP